MGKGSNYRDLNISLNEYCNKHDNIFGERKGFIRTWYKCLVCYKPWHRDGGVVTRCPDCSSFNIKVLKTEEIK